MDVDPFSFPSFRQEEAIHIDNPRERVDAPIPSVTRPSIGRTGLEV